MLLPSPRNSLYEIKMDKYRPCPSIFCLFTSGSQHPPRSTHAVYLGVNAYAYYKNKTLENISDNIYLSNIEHDVTTSKILFLSLYVLIFFLKLFSCIHGNFLLCCIILGFTLCYVRWLNGSGLFPLFQQFLEAEMTRSPPIIVRECILKNQNLCFASR